MSRENRTPIRARRKNRMGTRLLSLLLTAALLLISIQFHRINAQLETLRIRLREIERMTDMETETAALPDISAQTDYIDTLPVLDVGKPTERTEAEVLEQLNRLGEENPVIAEIAASSGDYPMALLTALANNPEMADFAAGYPAAVGNTASGPARLPCPKRP